MPFADTDCFVIPDEVGDEQALFCSDAAPTGFMGADFLGLQGSETVAVWGCGGVGLMAQQGATVLGAERVIAIERIPERLRLAERLGAEALDYSAVTSVVEALQETTGGRGPDACIDAVGMEGHGHGVDYAYDRVGQALRMTTDRARSLREAIAACRKDGGLAVLGVFGIVDEFPLCIVMNKGLTIRSAQQHGQGYVPRLLDLVAQGRLDTTALATHTMSLEEPVRGFQIF